MEWKEYLYDNGTLINKLGIKSAEKLSIEEKRLSHVNSLTLPPVSLDFKGLKSIHQHLFNDVYSWAGEPRQVPMMRTDSVIPFTAPSKIEDQADKIFTQLKNDDFLKSLNRDDFAKKAAQTFGEINQLHPFREGNGRTQRLFIQQVAEQAGHSIDFSQITQKRMYEASHDFSNNKPAKMERLFAEAVSPEKKTITQEFNDFLKSAKGLEFWNNQYIASANYGISYEGKFVGQAKKSFTMRLDNDHLIIGENKHLKQKYNSGDRINITITNKENAKKFVARKDENEKER